MSASDILIRIEGRAGCITLNRPKALNALTWEMCRAVSAALATWAADPAVALVVIDGAGPRAFCAGGDIAEMYATGTAGDFAYGQAFWRDEYRMNAALSAYPKPIVSFLHGFTMGGGVGIGCHAGLRIVGESTRVAMPECSIGLVPDVGGSMLLARAPGRLGVYLGLTGAQIGAADAIFAGFADTFLPESDWDGAKAALRAGDLPANGGAAPAGRLAARMGEIDRLFASDRIAGIRAALAATDSDFAREALGQMARNSPLAMACTLAMRSRLGPCPGIREALALEYRFTSRAAEHADFLEGIRAAIIDRDRSPRWRHGPDDDLDREVAATLAPAEGGDLTF